MAASKENVTEETYILQESEKVCRYSGENLVLSILDPHPRFTVYTPMSHIRDISPVYLFSKTMKPFSPHKLLKVVLRLLREEIGFLCL